MTGRMNWPRANKDGMPKLSIIDEQDQLDNDRAGRWLAKADKQPVGNRARALKRNAKRPARR